ncbi:MAG TPA: tetratricopeptide repeat protein [Pyrinomonadaceae bacterium]|jgi:hypothetical protein
MSTADYTVTTAARAGDASARERARLRAAVEKLERGAVAGAGGTDGRARQRVALAEGYFRLAVLPDTDPAEALALVQKSIECDPFHPKFFFHLGRLLHRAGDFRGAVYAYREALKLAPTNHRAHAHLALALLELGDKEKTLARDVLKALAAGQDPGANELDKLNQLLDAWRKDKEEKPEAERADGGKSAEPARKGGGKDGEPAAASKRAAQGDGANGSRWPGLWRITLVDALTSKGRRRPDLDAQLKAGERRVRDGEGVAEYAVACLFPLLLGDLSADSLKNVAARLDGEQLKQHAEHPAVRLARTTLELARLQRALPEAATEGEGKAQDDPARAAFIPRACEAVAAGLLPAELVCFLHYLKFGPDSALPAADALRLLEAYAPAIKRAACFDELRIAVLDGFARRAWVGEKLDLARLLWRETIPLDPHRIAVAHNLALVAARTHARDDYEAAWERAFELRYLHAAAAGNPRVLLEDRRTMHLAFAQQSEQRYAEAGKAKDPKEREREALAAWLADRDAVAVWLREWDFYYLNSRLRFRSPVHLLGVSRDASGEVVTEARAALLRQIETLLSPQPWAGIKTFCALAEELVNEAAEAAADLTARRRDPFYEEEKADADALAYEAITRGFRLHDMLRVLAERRDGAQLALGAALARHLFALPWRILQPICAARGLIDPDLDLVEHFENVFVRLALADETEPEDERAAARRLNQLAHALEVLPDNVPLRFRRCRYLLTARRLEETYAEAVAAVPLAAALPDPKEADLYSHNLCVMADNAAFAAFKPSVKKLETDEQVERYVAEWRAVLARFPRAVGFRKELAEFLIKLGRGKYVTAAGELLQDGLPLALTDEQRDELSAMLGQAGQQARSAAVEDEVRALLDGAVQSVNGVVKELNRDPSAAARERARATVRQAVADARRAAQLAAKAGLNEARERAEKTVEQLGALEQKLG